MPSQSQQFIRLKTEKTTLYDFKNPKSTFYKAAYLKHKKMMH